MSKKKKGIIIGASLVVLVGLISIILIKIFNKEDAYRIIKIYEVEGTAKVTRDNIGEIEPYNNMLLESGDLVFLDTGTMTLKMDDDKYAYVEEQTEFSIIAKGTAENRKTTIKLIKGAITNEIQNKLSEESSYEVNTPNSTMAVRGTIFRVEVYYDENGVCYTKVSVFEGSVSTKLIYPDGSISDEEVYVEAGKEIIIYEDDSTTDYLGDIRDIDYSQLPEKVIALLETILDDFTGYATATDAREGEFTVTFMYNGNVFGTQVIKEGECAYVPTLMPAQTGSWDFDFSTPIMEDTEINWK